MTSDSKWTPQTLDLTGLPEETVRQVLGIVRDAREKQAEDPPSALAQPGRPRAVVGGVAGLVRKSPEAGNHSRRRPRECLRRLRRMNILVDTNVILRSAEPGHVQHQAAIDAIDALAKQGNTLCLVPQNFYEFWVVSARPLAQNGRGKSPDEVIAEFSFLESHFAVLSDNRTVFDEWKRLMAGYKVTGKPSHDARLVAAMLAHGITHILTFNDQDFRRYAGVTVISPASVTAASQP